MKELYKVRFLNGIDSEEYYSDDFNITGSDLYLFKTLYTLDINNYVNNPEYDEFMNKYSFWQRLTRISPTEYISKFIVWNIKHDVQIAVKNVIVEKIKYLTYAEEEAYEDYTKNYK